MSMQIARVTCPWLRTISAAPLLATLAHRLLSTSSTFLAEVEHKVTEVQIPVPALNCSEQGYIAGRLFQGAASTSKPSSSPEYPPIICVHGWGDTAASFDPILPQIVSGRNMTALSFDMTGHGRSSHPLGQYTDLHNETVLTILRLIRHFKWDKVTMLGHSFGGLVSLSFTATFPELVHNFVGLDILPPLAFGIRNKNTFLPFAQYNLESILEIENKTALGKPVPEYTREEMIERMMKGRKRQGGLTREGCDMLVDRGSIVQPNGKLRFSHDPRGQSFFFNGLLSLGANVPLFAQNIKCPALLVNLHSQPKLDKENEEDEQPIIRNKGELEELMTALKINVTKFKVVEIEATHHAHMLSPKLVSPSVIDFLKPCL